jgi:hypothetical protein
MAKAKPGRPALSDWNALPAYARTGLRGDHESSEILSFAAVRNPCFLKNNRPAAWG